MTTLTANNYFQIMEKVSVFAPSHLPGVCRSVTRSESLKIVLGLRSKVLAGSDVHTVLVCGEAFKLWLGLQTCSAQTLNGSCSICFASSPIVAPKMARKSCNRVKFALLTQVPLFSPIFPLERREIKKINKNK